MVSFSEDDIESHALSREEQMAELSRNVEKVLDSVAEKAVNGDLKAAQSFAAIVQAHTRREELLAPKIEKLPQSEGTSIPAGMDDLLRITIETRVHKKLTEQFSSVLDSVTKKINDGDMEAAPVFAELLDAQTRRDDYVHRRADALRMRMEPAEDPLKKWRKPGRSPAGQSPS
jgi:hypothetical protein